jgi:predicted nucleotidyltransferase
MNLDSHPLSNLLTRYASELRRRYGDDVHQVRLFRSYARGGANEDSDVDVAVVLDHVDWKRQGEVIDLATDLGLDSGIRISPTILEKSLYDRWRHQERPLVMDIEREGIPL